MSCGVKTRFSLLVRKLEEGEIPPLCSRCGGILRPGVVLFGDNLPQYYQEALEEVKKSDLLLIVGSSLEIAPVNYLPELAGKYIIINKEGTYYDRGAAVVWHESAGKALEQIQRVMRKGINI